MTVSQRLPDRVWAELNAMPKRGRGWGAADRREKIITPALITEPTRLTINLKKESSR